MKWPEKVVIALLGTGSVLSLALKGVHEANKWLRGG